jgi:hypothetical protein
MLAVHVDYSKCRYPCWSNSSDSGHTFMCSMLSCRTPWFSLGLTYYCPFVRTRIGIFCNNPDLMTFLRKIEVYSNSYIAMSVTPFTLWSKYLLVNSLESLGWMRENLSTKTKLWAPMLARSCTPGQERPLERTSETDISILWMTKWARCVPWCCLPREMNSRLTRVLGIEWHPSLHEIYII